MGMSAASGIAFGLVVHTCHRNGVFHANEIVKYNRSEQNARSPQNGDTQTKM